jgi:hypothetical protein
MKTKQVYFVGLSYGYSLSWIRREALELCNMAGLRLLDVEEKPVYEDYQKEALFSKKIVDKQRYKRTDYYITIEDTDDVIMNGFKLMLKAWVQGSNSGRR